MRISSRLPLERLACIDREIREGGWPNANDLARTLEVAPRTIQRDIQFLRDRLNAPIEFDPVRNGYRYADPAFCLPFFKISEGELLALFLGERLLQVYGDSPFASDLAGFFEKVKAFLPESVSFDLRHLSQSASIRRTAVDIELPRLLQELHQAIRDERQLELVYWYASRDETCRRVVDPYHLASIDGDWFLIAYCHLREEIRMFAPARIRELHPTGEPIKRPADFRVSDYLDAGFRKVRGTGPAQVVRLRFATASARYVREKRWHPTQQLEEHADGSLMLSLAVTHLVEVRRWVLSFGADCEVLEPTELRDQIFDEVCKMSDAYRRIRGSGPH